MTPDAEDGYVFDTGPLMHFARAGWLGALKFVTAQPPYSPPRQCATNSNATRHRILNFIQY